jgi:hypothetical protein
MPELKNTFSAVNDNNNQYASHTSARIVEYGIWASKSCLLETYFPRLSLKVTSHQDLKRLCEVCRRFNDIVTPHLYRSLVLSAPELSLKDLVMILGTIPSKNLSYIQEFGFRVPIHEQVESRSVHQSSNNEHLPFIDDDLQDGLAEFLTNDGNMDFEDMDDDDTTEDEDEVCKGTCF